MVIFFSSCSDRSESELAVFKALDESLVNSNNTINNGTETTLALIEQKLSDPATTYRARVWQPKAMQIGKLSSDINAYIENLKSNLKKEARLVSGDNSESFSESNKDAVNRLFVISDKGKDLNDHLIKYKENLMAIDSQLTKIFKNSVIITASFDSADYKNQNMNKIFFDNTTVIAALAMLSQLQNNVKNIENRMVQFCYYNIPSADGYFTTYSAIIGQSSTYVRAGEKIEITSGVGYFSSRQSQPEITVNGTNINIDETGVAVYKFKASTKAGKHIVPVKINFTDQEGKKQLITKDVEYTVSKEINKKD